MKRSEVMKELLSSYYFQHGSRVNLRVVDKAKKLIRQFEKCEDGIGNQATLGCGGKEKIKLVVNDALASCDYPEDYIHDEQFMLHRYSLDEIISELDNRGMCVRTLGYSSSRKGFDRLVSLIYEK